MTFILSWSVTALVELNRIVAAADDPDAVRQAVLHMEYDLRRTPRDMGESRDPGFRVWYGDKVGLLYKLDETKNTVEVLAAAPSRRR